MHLSVWCVHSTRLGKIFAHWTHLPAWGKNSQHVRAFFLIASLWRTLFLLLKSLFLCQRSALLILIYHIQPNIASPNMEQEQEHGVGIRITIINSRYTGISGLSCRGVHACHVDHKQSNRGWYICRKLEIKGRKGVREVNKNMARKQFLEREGEKLLFSIQYYSSRWVPAIFFSPEIWIRPIAFSLPIVSRQILEIRKFTRIFQGD